MHHIVIEADGSASVRRRTLIVDRRGDASACGPARRNGPTAVLLDPPRDLDRIEPQQVAPLDERDAPLGHQPSNVTDIDTKMTGERRDVEQVRQTR